MIKDDTVKESFSLTDNLYFEIKKDIQTLVLKPGEKISIAVLAKKYKTGTSQIKQALHQLEIEGCIIDSPGNGLFIRMPKFEDVVDAFDIQIMLHTYFAENVISTLNYNEQLRNQLQMNMEAQKKCVEKEPTLYKPEEYFLLDFEFHTLYMKATGSKAALEIFNRTESFSHVINNYLKRPHSRDIESVEEHQRILNAAFSGDVEGLKVEMTRHIENAREALKLIYKVQQML